MWLFLQMFINWKGLACLSYFSFINVIELGIYTIQVIVFKAFSLLHNYIIFGNKLFALFNRYIIRVNKLTHLNNIYWKLIKRFTIVSLINLELSIYNNISCLTNQKILYNNVYHIKNVTIIYKWIIIL